MQLIFIVVFASFIYYTHGKILPNGFYLDIDGISIAPNNGHICALEVKAGLEMGGQPKCWGMETDVIDKSPAVCYIYHQLILLT
jgi:hypothetical protein